MYLYVEKESFLHTFHPVVKILMLITGFIIAIIFNAPSYLLFFILLTILMIIYAGGITNVYRMRVILILLFLFSTILWAFFIKEGKTIIKFGFATVTDKSLLYGIGMGLRLNLMVLSGLLFFSITMIEEFSFGLHKIGLPYPFCFALSMAFRLVPLFLQEGATVVEAQTLRGLDLTKGNIFTKIKNHFPLIVPIFITTIKKMDNLFLALESKGFKPYKNRTFYLDKSLKSIDYLSTVILMFIIILCIVLRISGHGIVLDRL
ncbi:MAG: energy-coupling factor transporter transmembrane protein EcfT [candidate division WOR-3 bacterium]|nr:energy-coupling factor transporter transmembrane protein EcfT [candidate division WOR-3 bacterium]